MRCEVCNQDLAAGSLASHLQSQNNVRHCYLGEAAFTEAPRTFEARFMPVAGKWLCPVPNYPQGQEGKGCRTETNLWSHFAPRPPRDTVQVGGICPDKCHHCEMQAQGVGFMRHEQTDQECRKLAAQLSAEMAETAERKFTTY